MPGKYDVDTSIAAVETASCDLEKAHDNLIRFRDAVGDLATLVEDLIDTLSDLDKNGDEMPDTKETAEALAFVQQFL